MENFDHGKWQMYLTVKSVCDAKPSVWGRSNGFADAFVDFCACIQNIHRLRASTDDAHAVNKGIEVEMTVADTILTTELDEYMEQFEPVDVVFVDDYTAARSLEAAAQDDAAECIGKIERL